MKIVDLTPEQEKLYFVCLEDWSEEMKEAGDHKEVWFSCMKGKGKGLRVKLARDDEGNIGGMIQYLPVEHSFVQGQDLFFINCIWVHGHKKGRGNFQKRGMGKKLLEAAESDAQAQDSKGMVAWGISLPFFMRASWFKKQGYKKIDKQGMQVLLWKPFKEDAIPPQWIRRKKPPETIPGKVTLNAFLNGWCPAQNLVFERAKRAAMEFGEKVIFKEYNTKDRKIFLEWGISDALFIDDKEVRMGPPPSYDKINKLIARRVRKLSGATSR